MNTLTTFFDKIILINLNRRTDRLFESFDEFKLHGIPTSKVDVFEAYDNPTNGHSGCTRSHRMLLRQIADSNWDRVLIFEDDVAVVTLPRLQAAGFTPNSKVWMTHLLPGVGDDVNERFNYLSKFLPDKWDVLYLGASYGEPPISRLNPHVIRGGFMKTTSSYGITREFARIWTDKVDKAMGSDDLDRHPGPIDDTFGSMAKDHLYYVLDPRMFYQRLSKSDLCGETNVHLFSMTDRHHPDMV